MMQTTICASGLNALYNIGLNPIIDQSLDISFIDPFYLNADLCKLLNRSAYQGFYFFPTIYHVDGSSTKVMPTLYIDGKDMGAIGSLKIQEIKALAETSYVGSRSKIVYDGNIRKASEIKGNRINLDLKLPEEVQAMAPVGYKIIAKLNKLVIYEKDRFFAEHSDTQHGDDHIGTLVACLPVPYEGGTFILSDDRNELRLSFDEIMSGDQIPWVAFYSGMKHQVEVMKSGVRMTLQFDLKVEPKEEKDSDDNNLSAIFEREGVFTRSEYKCKLKGFNQDIINTIQNKLKTILSAPRIEPIEVKSGDSSSLIKKRERPDDDEPFELENSQPTKQPKLDSSTQNDDCDNKNAENKHPDGIAILLTRRYGATSLSPETLKGIDSILYHAFNEEFKVEVKLVVMEQKSDYKGGYKGQPIEVVALSKMSDINDPSSEEDDEEVEPDPTQKYSPKMHLFGYKEKFQRFKHPSDDGYYEAEEERYTGEVKKVYIVTGVPPKTISKLVTMDYIGNTENEAQEAVDSYMQAALFIYPK